MTGRSGPGQRHVIVTFDLDAEAAIHGMGLEPASRPSLRSQHSYGPEVGVPRLLELLRVRGIRATFFVPGRSAELHAAAVDAILADGHEVGHHGHDHRPPHVLDERGERHELERGLEVLGRFGVRPVGYRAPWWELSPRSVALLREFGFRYDSSLFDRDEPYLMSGDPALVEIPVSWALDDWERFAFWPDLYGSGVIGRPSEVAEAWYEEVIETTAVGGVAVLTMHPFISGRPSRVAALGRLLDRIGEHGVGEFVTCDRVAMEVTRRAGLDRSGPTTPQGG